MTIPSSAVVYAPWFLSCCLGFLSNFLFSVLGSLTAAEPVAALILPVLVSGKVVRREKWFADLDQGRLMLVALSIVISMAGYMLSDLYWGSSLLQSAKGMARFGVLAINACVLWMLFAEHRNAWVGFIVGVILGRVVVTFVQTPLFNDYWKFGFALPVAYATLLYTAWLGRKYVLWTSCCLVALAAVNVFFGSRSAALLIFLFALQRPFGYRKSAGYSVVLTGIALLGVVAILGFSGQSQRQSTTRSDIERWTHIRFCIDGIARNPVIGNGTWYEASGFVEHYYELLYRNSEYGRYGGFETQSGPLQISMHTQLLNGWAEGGILGSAFFFVCLLLALRDLLFLPVDDRDPADEIRDFFLIQCLMALAFSPFSGLARWPLAFQLWYLLRRRTIASRKEPDRRRSSTWGAASVQ